MLGGRIVLVDVNTTGLHIISMGRRRQANEGMQNFVHQRPI